MRNRGEEVRGNDLCLSIGSSLVVCKSLDSIESKHVAIVRFGYRSLVPDVEGLMEGILVSRLKDDLMMSSISTLSNYVEAKEKASILWEPSL